MSHKKGWHLLAYSILALSITASPPPSVLCNEPKGNEPKGNEPKGDEPKVKLEVPYEPTPSSVVTRMLELAGVTSKDIVYDLGCGDGRIVIMAAKKFGARGVGVDLDPQRIKEAVENAKHEGVEGRVNFRVADINKTRLSEATVVTLFLLERVNVSIRPKLFAELRPGTRVVSHAFHMRAWQPDKTVRHPKARKQRIYSWVIPASVGGRWGWLENLPNGAIPFRLDLSQEFQAVKSVLSSPGLDPVKIRDTDLTGDRFRCLATVKMDKKTFDIKYEGIVQGNTINGTQEWRKGPIPLRRPWKAERKSQVLAGRWKFVVAAPGNFLNGSLEIGRAKEKLVARYRLGEGEPKAVPVTLYAWGASILFELSTGDKLHRFSGTFHGGTGTGEVSREGWAKDLSWTGLR